MWGLFRDITLSSGVALAAAAVYIVVRAAVIAVKKQTVVKRNEAVYLLLAVYAANFVYWLLFPALRFGIADIINNGIGCIFMRHNENEIRFNLIPLRTIYLYTFGTDSRLAETWDSFKLRFWAGHIILSVSMGIIMQMFAGVKGFRLTAGKAAAVSAAIFAAVEIIQYPIGRTADIDAVIINTLGCLAGFGIYALISGHRKRGAALSSQTA